MPPPKEEMGHRLFLISWTVVCQSPLVHGILQARILEISMINSASLHWQVVFFFYLWATGEAPPSPNSKHQNAPSCSPNSKHQNTPSCSEHQPNPCLAVREQYGHHSHSRLWTENGVGVSTMLTPFCGSVLHSDPNGTPGNLLEDACILLLTHISWSEFMRVFRTTKVRVPVHKTGDSLSVRAGRWLWCRPDPGLAREHGAGLRTLGTDHRARVTAPSRDEIAGKKKSVKSESHHFPNSKTEWLFLFSIWKCSPLRNKVPGSNKRNEF